jgi:hypothetical protein
MFAYEVALSFAGEQRSEVEKVAACLKSAGVTVFYDDYEKANLWGKNLYDHLSDVYQNKARYCIIFASREYAEKTWTNHERQSAQARALKDKGAEYILPVRFDSTEIPGLLPTIGYLDFRKEGPSGVCSAFLAKLGRSVGDTSSIGMAAACSLSPRALINAMDGRLAVPRVESCTWGEEINLSVRDSEGDSFFSQLRGERTEVVVAHAFDVALAKPLSATRQVANGSTTWKLSFSPTRSDFSDSLEMGSGSTSADQFAEMRVRRLLLNEYVQQETGKGHVLQHLNDTTREIMIRGLNPIAKIEKSRFPSLFAALNGDPDAFLEIAWIVAVADLKLSASVEAIETLKLTLFGTALQVEFAGRRHRKYVNVDPYEIRVQGKLELGARS